MTKTVAQRPNAYATKLTQKKFFGKEECSAPFGFTWARTASNLIKMAMKRPGITMSPKPRREHDSSISFVVGSSLQLVMR